MSYLKKLVVMVVCICCYAVGVQAAHGQQLIENIIPIAEVRIDKNDDGRADMLGDTVTVAGLANASSGVFHEVYLQIFIQDESSGITLFAESIDQSVSRGDSVVATGVVQEYFGITEVEVTDYQVFEGSSPLPEPVSLNTAVANYSRYEGMLVSGTGTVVGTGNRFNGKYLEISVQDSVSRTIPAYVSNFHRQYDQFDFESLRSGDRVHVTGVLSFFSPGETGPKIYRVYLRTPQDLETLGITQSTLVFLGVIGLVLAIVVSVWIVSLRSQVRRKTKAIQQALEEKETLIKEIHHRVKNNLAIVSGLIELQLDESHSDSERKVLLDTQSRIQSMALVHDKLYRTTNVTDIGMQTYIRELVEALKSTFSGENEVELNFDIDDIRLHIDQAIPCGLLINELVVNSFKHAFEKDQGILTVKLKEEGDTYNLVIADNGVGLPNDFREKMQSSLGLMLVETFKDQLDAEMEVENRDGAQFSFIIPTSGE